VHIFDKNASITSSLAYNSQSNAAKKSIVQTQKNNQLIKNLTRNKKKVEPRENEQLAGVIDQ